MAPSRQMCPPTVGAVTDEAAPAILDDIIYGPLLSSDRPVILVVEDDDDSRATVCAILRRHGLDTVEAASAGQAFDVLSRRPVSAVVLDLGLPDEPGEVVCTLLRSDPDTVDLPVVMLTARDSLESELAGILTGADAYLVKPVSPRLLVGRLHDLL